ncbi:uroporphyrinogen-III synthase [Sphingomonas sp.]|jgi:uroporphyrinogen-III synthase|uniref:uroporphyrinogen-III synthase n=1 Tax=Sphingomonas sp. TaxID=28214 RepID=UPI002623B4B3|nr:uroporphyrinogen-III synthase [Sphingomonas sp.]MDF2493581.1 hypothetical protein [Sphingomonas sp.]
MIRPLVVLRPEPGNTATANRITEAGFEAISLPLFAIAAVPWTAPPADDFDALLLTSANAVRQAGEGLHTLAELPIVAVGHGTAEAAQQAGLSLAAVGNSDGKEALALAQAHGWRRVIRLTGREHIHLPGVTDIVVYASDPLDPGAHRIRAVQDCVVLLHSPRAAQHFSSLVAAAEVARSSIRLAALSQAVAAAAGNGWQQVDVAAAPHDPALVETAMTLAIDR